MPCPHPWIRRSLAGVALVMATAAAAEPTLREETLDAQRAQAELQARIDAADEAVRDKLLALRQAREEIRRLSRYNAELAPLVERQAATLTSRREALDTLSQTREALPGLMRGMVVRLRTWVEDDMPFLRDERLARVDSLETLLADPELDTAEKLERVLAAWHAELDYGRELDTWRGELPGEPPREVDFLRLGRVGWYYLTPDGRQGGVWQAAPGEWRPLGETALAEVRKGMAIAREQRAPALLDLPVSQPREDA
ncbi:DUF3450 domain-containing protein [Halomonas nitroreducens]|uniref:DUF3450 domain-containing protein n=1 Tax=Halomonas nitroreducens TaxID=447425 RepID=A0A3S0HRS9_9GAMM|nr:DUF3450 domain-containing protein [Halomonas nitroreducens]RTR06004.1 DUF3450 domain-containing protein [Halomonas nitroreducens]